MGGITNPNNNCFINSLLQSLFCTFGIDEMISHLTAIKQQLDGSASDLDIKNLNLVGIILNIAKKYKEATRTLNINRQCKALRSGIDDNFTGQQDVHELFMKLDNS